MATQNSVNNLGKLLQTVVQQYDPAEAQDMTTTHADIDGSDYAFTPPSASSLIVYSYRFQISNVDATWELHCKLLVDGTLEAESETNFVSGESGIMGGHLLADFAYTIQSWGISEKTIKMQGREYGATTECKLHETGNWDGAATEKLRRATLLIQEFAT